MFQNIFQFFLVTRLFQFGSIIFRRNECFIHRLVEDVHNFVSILTRKTQVIYVTHKFLTLTSTTLVLSLLNKSFGVCLKRLYVTWLFIVFGEYRIFIFLAKVQWFQNILEFFTVSRNFLDVSSLLKSVCFLFHSIQILSCVEFKHNRITILHVEIESFIDVFIKFLFLTFKFLFHEITLELLNILQYIAQRIVLIFKLFKKRFLFSWFKFLMTSSSFLRSSCFLLPMRPLSLFLSFCTLFIVFIAFNSFEMLMLRLSARRDRFFLFLLI